MEQLLKQAKAAGLNDTEGKQTLGGILSLLKEKMSGTDFTKITEALPGSEALVQETDQSRAAGTAGGGNDVMSSAMGFMSKMGSGDKDQGGTGGTPPGIESVPQLLTFLGSLGIDQKQVMAFLPQVAKALQTDAGVDASSALGVSGSNDTGATSGGGGLAQQATSFLGSFGGK
jgi:hypothetical protein